MTATHDARMLTPPHLALILRSSIAIENEKPNSLVATLNAWILEDLLDVPSYGELLGKAALQRMRKLESKQHHFFPLQNQYGRTIAVGPGTDCGGIRKRRGFSVT